MRPIKEGDVVTVQYVDGGVLRDVVVTHTPVDVGDLWYFVDSDGVVFAQNPMSPNLDTIVRFLPEEEEPECM